MTKTAHRSTPTLIPTRDGTRSWRPSSSPSHKQPSPPLVAGVSANNDQFGQAISIDGNFALVGAPKPIGAPNPGKAYIFEFSSGTWSLAGRATVSSRIMSSISRGGKQVRLGKLFLRIAESVLEARERWCMGDLLG